MIAANAGSGVVLDGTLATGGSSTLRTVVQGNFIGTDASGTLRLGNGGDGVHAVRLTPPSSGVYGNLIAANRGDGVGIVNTIGPSSRPFLPFVGGNYIGTNAAGTGALGNGGNGVAIHASTGLTIGAAGTATPPGPISPASTFRNVISANGGHGVFITGDRVVTGSNSSVYVANNYIGTDVTGAAALGNAGSGVFATVGTHQIGDTNAGNLISANGGDGITLAGAPTANSPAPLTNNIISANRIGTDARGSDAVTGLGNRGHGVAVYDSPNNQVGSAAVAGLANVIAFNLGSGVAVRGNGAASPGSAGGNAIYRNSIFSNGRLGIDLVNGFEGVTPNDPRDADTGPNLLQNFPVIASVATSAGLTDIHFTLDSEPGHTYQVEFYSNLGPGPGPGAGPDLDGHAQGKTFIGSTRVATNSAGSVAASLRLPGGPTPPGSLVTATATRVDGGTGSNGTSEFSAAVQVQANLVTAVVGRYAFYNASAFDGSAGPAPDDDIAIAGDKQALLPGAGPATFANYTSYPRGLNGIMVDLRYVPVGIEPAVADFSFRTGRAGDGGAFEWVVGPKPASVSVRRGAGVGGSDRLTLIWMDYTPDASDIVRAVANGWLEVTMKASVRTGLQSPDVFYFGNLIGETGDAPTPARVSAADLGSVRSHLNAGVPVTSAYDLNRDGLVNALDLAVARSNLFHTLPPLPPPDVAGAAVIPLPDTSPAAFAAAGVEMEGVWLRVAT